ncbi:hypothetical protein K6119_16340 [Paracrocinitomix mangrovi]|uniref:hypothetical protein n=1 Tax=Paracrocinitomix mangrovi TaxID=2862509 RepID=UPI001C8DA20E|nr:hypothetical protein [Paracrocinitomix mangrovi]UKN01298.1 hypothetical protein K6119_16340 [Paracrocinitomix mangrovi]
MKRLFKILCLFILLTSITHSSFGQSYKNIRYFRRFGIEATSFGPATYCSLNFSYFISKNVNIDAGFGMLGAFAGLRFFPGTFSKPHHWSPYLGFYFTNIIWISPFAPEDYSKGLYMPLGIQYLGNKGFSFSVEAAYISIKNDLTPIWGSLKLGYYFPIKE